MKIPYIAKINNINLNSFIIETKDDDKETKTN